MNRVEALHHLNQMEEDLVNKSLDEVKAVALGKEVSFANERKAYVIDAVEEQEPNKFTLWLKQTKGRKEDGRRAIGTNAIAVGRAITTDEELIALCKELYKNTEAENQAKEVQRLQAIQDREERERQEIQRKKDFTIQSAILDSKNNNREVYKLFTGKNRLSGKALDLYDRYDRDLYVITYEQQEDIKRRDKLVQSRITNVLSEYPGDLNELLKWIKENATDVSIAVSPAIAEREQAALDRVNEKRGTNYQVTIIDGSDYNYPGYRIRFKNTVNAPKEFKDWIVKKHSNETKDITVWEDKPALNKNVLGSNAIVKDLIFNPEYGFTFIKK